MFYILNLQLKCQIAEIVFVDFPFADVIDILIIRYKHFLYIVVKCSLGKRLKNMIYCLKKLK